jgi:hypothetical protein
VCTCGWCECEPILVARVNMNNFWCERVGFMCSLDGVKVLVLCVNVLVLCMNKLISCECEPD